MLTGTRNILALILLSGFLFADWNYSASLYHPIATKIETDVFKYGLIYYSTGSPESRIEIEPSPVSKSFRQLNDGNFIVKTRRTGNKFYHQFYKIPADNIEVEQNALLAPALTLMNPGKIVMPFCPCLVP